MHEIKKKLKLNRCCSCCCTGANTIADLEFCKWKKWIEIE